MTELEELGYYLLPLPPRSKEPPPAGWPKATKPYEVRPGENVAIGTRGELGILITNDERSTEWATREFGTPNVRSRRGGHWYFRARARQANEANAETSVGAMELHVRNKYALIPPSIHPTGMPYEWVRRLPRVADLPECPDLRDLWHPRGTHHAQLLRMSTAKARDGANAETVAGELRAYRDAHLPDPAAHPDRELEGMARSAIEKFGRPDAGPRLAEQLEEFDPETGDVFLAVEQDGRETIGIAWVADGRIYRTTVAAELRRIEKKYEGKTGKGELREKATAIGRLLDSLPFTRVRDALWPLPDDPTLVSVAEWERANGPLLDRIVRYFSERVITHDADGPLILSVWTMAASARLAATDFAPRILFEAPWGWGKSTAGEAVQVVVLRGVYGAALTPASVHRMMNEWHPVLLVDESAIADNPELQRVIRAGFKRGARIIRAAQNADRGVVLVDPFGFVILTTQVDTKEDVVSRCWAVGLLPGTPPRRVTQRDPEATGIRTLLLRLRLDVLAGSEYRDAATVADRAHSQPGLETRSRDKLSALWPIAVRYGVEERLIGAAARVEETAGEQLAASDKGLIVAALDAIVEGAGGARRVKASDLEVRRVHAALETILLEIGEARTVGVGEYAHAEVDPRRYGIRDFTSRNLRELGFEVRTVKGRARVDYRQFLVLWESVRSRYLNAPDITRMAPPEGGPSPVIPTAPLHSGVPTSENLSDETPTPPLHHPYPIPTPVGVGVGIKRPEEDPPTSRSADPTGFSGERACHPNCPLCRTATDVPHVCYACPACRYAEAHPENVGPGVHGP